MGTPIADPKSRWKLRAVAARNVLLVHAVEQADPRGDLLPVEDRRNATRKALEEYGERPDRWLGPRAAGLVERLRKIRPDLVAKFDVPELPRSWTILVPVLAFLAGLGTNALGSSRTINILAPPLFGLLLWNFGVYLVLLFRTFLPQRERPPLPGWIRRGSPLGRRLQKPGSETSEEAAESVESRIGRRFAQAWLPTVSPLLAARLSRLFHLASVTAVVGVVAGMYLRGLGLEYRAAWESTFLGASAVDALLGTLFGPAGAILGIELPSAAELATPASGPAAPWIHMWAVTALIGVAVPRLLLALWQTLRAWRLGRGLPVDLSDGYLRRLLASVETREENVQILLYSYRPAEKVLSRLRTLLLDLVGARAQFRGVVSSEYGDDPPPADDAGLRVAVFSATQTPELEVHGEWLQGLRRERTDGQSLLVVVDETPFKLRLDDDSGRRLESRQRAWRRTLEHAELPGVFLELDPEQSMDAQLEALAGGLWPTRSP